MQLLADTIRVPESWSWLLVLLTILSTGAKPGRNHRSQRIVRCQKWAKMGKNRQIMEKWAYLGLGTGNDWIADSA